MKEAKGNLLSDEVLDAADAVCVTTNGIIKKNGRAVMGAGVAKAFNKYCSEHMGNIELDKELANKLLKNGNITQAIAGMLRPNKSVTWIIALPTKQDWKDKSPLWLIERSVQQLVELADAGVMVGGPKLQNIWLPRPGCANGGLSWEDVVKPAIAPLLDDRFTVCYL